MNARVGVQKVYFYVNELCFIRVLFMIPVFYLEMKKSMH